MSAIAVADALGRLAEATLTFEDELQGPETIDNGEPPVFSRTGKERALQ
jgi:hypothetical protein